jgi:hypothetical protein
MAELQAAGSAAAAVEYFPRLLATIAESEERGAGPKTGNPS